MKIVIGYSHVDSFAALRLLRWIDHLGGVSDPVCVVSTRLAARRPVSAAIKSLLSSRFPNSEWHELQTENERGWPHSSTHLFANSLRIANEDLLWLEPDCVPMRRGWYDQLKNAWLSASTPFVGCFIKGIPSRFDMFERVVGVPDHMTGCGFYGRNWREVCPQLAGVQSEPSGAWDLDHADAMMPHFTHTPLIQHFWQRDKKQAKVHLRDVKPGTALYHQCKDGSLMQQIDPSFATAVLTGDCYSVTTSNTMTKFFLTENVNRPVDKSGLKFNFEPCEYFGPTSSWWGVYATDNPAEFEKLEPGVASGAFSEITEEEFHQWLAKRKNPSSSHNITVLGKSQHRTNIAGETPAVVAEPAPAAPVAESVDDALQTKPMKGKKK